MCFQGCDVHNDILCDGCPQPMLSQNFAMAMRAAADMPEPSSKEGCHKLREIQAKNCLRQ
jgi:hypothetical protein